MSEVSEFSTAHKVENSDTKKSDKFKKDLYCIVIAKSLVSLNVGWLLLLTYNYVMLYSCFPFMFVKGDPVTPP